MDLASYLTKKEWSEHYFAKKSKIAHSTIHRAMIGLEIKLTTAAKIEIITKGEVTCLDIYHSLKKNKS